MRDADAAFDAEIHINQARSGVEGASNAVGANTTLTLALVGILLSETVSVWVIVWLAVSLCLSAMRIRHFRRIRSTGIETYGPDRVLREMRLIALATGCVWGLVPLAEVAHVGTSTLAFTVFIVVGATTTTLTQNFSDAPTNLLFMLPAMPASALALFATGGWAASIIGADILLLLGLLSRQALNNARAFRANERLRLSAVSMASSLEVANQRLGQLAAHDGLTGLANRSAFNDELDRLVRTHVDGCGEMALAIVDLDNFKVINDTQGHAAGDRALREVAGRLADHCRAGQFLARLGGDEFAIIVPGPDAQGVATELAGDLVETIGRPFMINGRQSLVGASVGLALFPVDARSSEDLFASADIALYDAKRKGKNRVALFEPRLKLTLDRQQRIESDIGRAIVEDELHVVFQPQVDLSTGETVGHEALIRWSHPDLGTIAPPEIVTAAQNTYVDDRLTAYVLGKACDFIEELTARGDNTSLVAVNVSPIEFRRSSPAATILGLIEQHGIDPRRLEIEITEEAILDFDLAEADLVRLAGTGMRIAIDDFGAGYFSLASVSSLPLHRLKIDRSFITAIDANPRHQTVVANILALARNLGLVAIAEGIETDAEAQTLQRLGCAEGQGYLFCRPVDAATALGRLMPIGAAVAG